MNIEDSIAIGDPYFYFDKSKIDGRISNQIKNPQTVILIPKFRRRLKENERLRAYLNLIEEARERYPDCALIIKLHHAEELLWLRQLQQHRLIKKNEVNKVGDGERNTGIGEMITINTILKSSAIIFSDYVGPHVLRRLAIFHKYVDLSENLYQYPSVSLEMNELITPLISNRLALSEQIEIAKVILGSKYLQNRQELGDTLGLIGIKGKLSPVAKKTYFQLQKMVGTQ